MPGPVAKNLHARHRLHARRIQMTPHTDIRKESRIGRADCIDARIQALRRLGRTPFHQRNAVRAAAQRCSQGQTC